MSNMRTFRLPVLDRSASDAELVCCLELRIFELSPPLFEIPKVHNVILIRLSRLGHGRGSLEHIGATEMPSHFFATFNATARRRERLLGLSFLILAFDGPGPKGFV